MFGPPRCRALEVPGPRSQPRSRLSCGFASPESGPIWTPALTLALTQAAATWARPPFPVSQTPGQSPTPQPQIIVPRPFPAILRFSSLACTITTLLSFIFFFFWITVRLCLDPTTLPTRDHPASYLCALASLCDQQSYRDLLPTQHKKTNFDFSTSHRTGTSGLYGELDWLVPFPATWSTPFSLFFSLNVLMNIHGLED